MHANPELMGGISLKSIGRVIMAPVKGVTHGALELGRGLITLDPGRMLAAPLKGATHGTLETVRGGYQASKGVVGGFFSALGWSLPAGGGSTTAPQNPQAPGTYATEEKPSLLGPALLVGTGVLAVYMIAKGKG